MQIFVWNVRRNLLFGLCYFVIRLLLYFETVLWAPLTDLDQELTRCWRLYFLLQVLFTSKDQGVKWSKITRVRVVTDFISGRNSDRTFQNKYPKLLSICEDSLPPLGYLGYQRKRRISHFGTRIVQGTIPSGLPVFWVAVPRCSRNGYGTSPNSWVQKKIVKLWQGTQDERLCPTKFLREFLSHSLFDFFRNLGNILLGHFWVNCVRRLSVPGILRCLSRNCC